MRLQYFIVLSLFFASGLIFAQNRDAVHFNAKAASMANAYSATKGDIFSMPFNSAGLASISSIQSAFSGNFGFGNMSYVNAEGLPDIRLANQWQLNFAAVAIPFELAQIPLTAGLAYQPQMNFNREFTSESSIPRTYKQDGGIDAISLFLAMRLTSELSIGAVLNYNKGYFRTNYDIHGEQFFEENQYDCFSLETAVLYSISQSLSAGLNLKLPHQLANDPGNITIIKDIPLFANIGLTYQPDEQWIFAADFHYRPWSSSNDFKDHTDEAKSVYDVSSWHFGLEYIYQEQEARFPIRAGISLNPYFSKTDMSGEQAMGIAFSSGAGLYLGAFTLNGAVIFESLNFWSGDLGAEVTKNWFNVMLDLHYALH